AGKFLTGHTTRRGPVTGLAAVPGGRSFVSGGGDQTVQLHDAPTGERQATFVGTDNPVTCVAVPPDGRSGVPAPAAPPSPPGACGARLRCKRSAPPRRASPASPSRPRRGQSPPAAAAGP